MLRPGIVRRVTLDDDTSPIGFQYYSRWGLDHLCHALWLDDEEPGQLHGLHVRQEHHISLGDPDLHVAAKVHNLRLA